MHSEWEPVILDIIIHAPKRVRQLQQAFSPVLNGCVEHLGQGDICVALSPRPGPVHDLRQLFGPPVLPLQQVGEPLGWIPLVLGVGGVDADLRCESAQGAVRQTV